MTQAHNVRVSARTAELTASDEGAWRFGGVAVGENDILYTDDGTPVLFTPEVLAEYAETQAGEPLSIDHPADEDGQPVYPPPVDEAPGKVPKAAYVPGQGLVYEATTHDETIANGVKAGSYEVSVHPTFDLGEQDPETGAYIPENVNFLDLSVVSKGMSASNTAEWGANAALASWTRQADIGAELDHEITASATHTPSYSGTNDSGSWSKPSLDDYGADDPSEVTSNFLATTASSFENVENYDDLKLPVVNPDNELQWGALTSAYSMAGQVGGLSDDDVSSVKSTIERLASEEFDEDLGSDDGEAEASAQEKDVEIGSLAWFRRMARKAGLTAAAPDVGDAVRWESSDGGEREPDDYRYGVVVDGLQDKADDQVLVAVYQPNSDGDGWENRNEQNQMSTDNLEVVGSNGKESLPAVSQVTASASAQAPDEGADTSTDADADTDDTNQSMADETTEETDEQTEEVEADAETETESEPESNVVEVDIGDHDSFDSFIEAKFSEMQEQTDKSEKVDEIIEAADDLDESDREELMASSEKLLEREYERVTGEVTASLPGSAGARRRVQASDDGDSLDAFGTGIQE